MATNLIRPRHLGTLRSVGGTPIVIPGNAFHYTLAGTLVDAFASARPGGAAPLSVGGGLANADALTVNPNWYTFPLGNTATLATSHFLTQNTPDAYAGNVLTLKGPGGSFMPAGTTIYVGIDFWYSGDVPTSDETLWAIGAAEGNAGYMSVAISALQVLRFNFKLANAGAETVISGMDLSGITGRISITLELQASSASDLAVRLRARHAGGTLSTDALVSVVVPTEVPILQSAASYYGLALGARTSASGAASNPRSVLGKAATGERSRLSNFYARRLASYDSTLLATTVSEQFPNPNVFPSTLRLA